MGVRATREVERQVRGAVARLPDVFARKLVVGFSGGQDSTCMLHVLRTFDVVAVHVDHALRADSAADAARVAAAARAIGVPIQVVRVEVAKYRRALAGWSVQQAARAARYQALASVAESLGAHAVLVAHTRDDQAETVLLNLLRGSGLDGLAGMPFNETISLPTIGPPLAELSNVPQGVRVVRPLLRVSRPTTQAYCAEQGLAVVEDASNQSRAYTRNRVRLDLLPALEHFNPAIRQVLARMADLVAEDVATLRTVLESLHAEMAQPIAGGLRYDLASWRSQPRGMQRRLLRRGLQALLGALSDVRAQPIDDALALLRSGSPGQTYHLPYGVELCVREDTFELRRQGRALQRNSRKTWDREVPRV